MLKDTVLILRIVGLDIDVYLDGYMSNVTPTKEYTDFIKVSNIRELKAVNMSVLLKIGHLNNKG